MCNHSLIPLWEGPPRRHSFYKIIEKYVGDEHTNILEKLCDGSFLQAGVHGGRHCPSKGFLDYTGDNEIPEWQMQRLVFNIQN